MSLNQINNFEELKQSIWKIISGEGEIKAGPVSVELSGANNTTTVTYAAEVDNGQLKFSLVYPQGQQNDFNQITEINLFFFEHSKYAIGDSTNANLNMHFNNANKYLLGIFTNIDSLASYTQDRKHIRAKINVPQIGNEQPSSNFNCIIGYGEILELLGNCPPVFTELYSKIVETSETYGQKNGGQTTILFPFSGVFTGRGRH